MTFDVHQLDTFVLVGAGVTLLAILAVRVSSRAGLPSLLLYLLMGVALGDNGIGIHFDDAELAHALGFAALAVILADGGLSTSWREVRPSMRLGLSLATLGVAVSVTIVALGAHYLLGLSWELSVLLGAVTSPTDAAAVFSVLRGSAALDAAGRCARGRVGAERRAHRRPGHADLHRRRGRPRAALHRWGSSSSSCSAGLLIGLAVGLRRRLADATRSPAVVGPLPARRALPRAAGVRRVRRPSTRPGSPRSTSPR